MPGRIAYIQPTLDSLLFQQTQTVDQFYLVLPEQPKDAPPYIMPTFLNQYIQRGLITVLWPSFDYGAIDKILHTLLEEDERFQKLLQQQQQLERHQIRILYLDDDMIYDPSLIQLLASKSDQYPDSVVALSGANLRSHFRQIGHSNPRKNRHPYLYYYLGGVDRFGDPLVDIVQGFMGVMVRLSFFDPNVSEFVDMATKVVVGNNNNKTTVRVPDAVRRSDDFVICGYLEYRGVPRRCVDGGGLKPVTNPVPSQIGNLGKTMNRNAMGAVTYLQSQWNIWQNYSFVNLETLPENIQQLIDCEAGRAESCPIQVKDASGKLQMWKVTELLDGLLLNHYTK